MIDHTREAVDARLDWERRIYRRLTATSDADPASALPAPARVEARPGTGLIALSWTSVPGAAGYVLERQAAGDDEPRILDHGGSDVPAIAGTWFADTGLRDGVVYRYRVGAVTGNEYPVWHWSEPVEASTRDAGTEIPSVLVDVDTAGNAGTLARLWQVIGSERLTQLRFGDDGHGHQIGAEFSEALRRAHDDLGVRYVRAHAILHDDNHVVTRAGDGSLRFDFSVVDELYDRILALGIRPVVELGFMPATLASDPDATVFTYRGIISPPRDWAEWHAVVLALVTHLVERYGLDEVLAWDFEVWNEPNLEVFWTGTKADYLRLYAEAARAVKAVDPHLRVGGPSTAAAEWIDTLAGFAAAEHLPLDLVTTHTYGNVPLDFRAVLARHGFADTRILWTEWGVGSAHFGPIHDGVAGAPFILSGYKSAQRRLEALAYWVVSDHFEELGRPPRLFHDGFGLQTVANLRKPRYWAVHLAAHLGNQVLPLSVQHGESGSLVEAWATRHDDGTIDVLAWNGTRNADLMHGDPRLARRVTVRLTDLPPGRYTVELARIDEEHSNIQRHLPADVDWPDQAQLAVLRAADTLHVETRPDIAVSEGTDGTARIDVHLPQPGVVRIRLRDRRPPSTHNEES